MEYEMAMPELALAGGAIVDAETGELAVVGDGGSPAAMTVANVCDRYAAAKIEAEALALRTSELRENMIHDMVDALLSDDDAYQADLAALAAARGRMARIEAELARFFGDRTSKVSLDTGRVLVTWGKPRETWSLGHPPAWFATDEAVQTLQRAIGDELLRLGVANEGNQIYGVETAVAQRVLEWLDPSRKVGDLPAPSITVRPLR